METLTRKLKFLATKTKTQLDADERVKQPQKKPKIQRPILKRETIPDASSAAGR